VVLGHPAIVRRAVALRKLDLELVEVGDPEEAEQDCERIFCLPCGPEDACDVPPASLDARGGQAAYEAIVAATQLALAGRVDGLVTGPLNKAALHAAGHHFPGHTELLASLCDVADVAMMLHIGPGESVRMDAGLGVAHATLHTALRNVFAELTSERVFTTAGLAHDVMGRLLRAVAAERPPRIGVFSLNPHVGEQGLFGDEEQRIIRPAVERGQAAGLALEGPLSSDTLVPRALAGEFDALVAMYHDQGHIPLKLLDMHRAVNITLGLPIIRTSVAHGTAFDLAWQGRADVRGMVAAIRTAAQLAESPSLKPSS
jgi:4-hydroxythreonine-4-phosphate dehydrogenase